MKIIAIANQKGGCGKSSTCAALAQAATAAGRRCLVIDLDAQGNLSYFLQGDTSLQGSYALLKGAQARDCIQRTACGVDLMAASWSLSTITTSTGMARRLQEGLKPVILLELYDFIFIDTPPAGGILQYCALQCCNSLLIPMQADVVSLQGFFQICGAAEAIKASNPALQYEGCLITRAQPRSTLARQMQQRIQEEAAARGIPFLGSIREGVAIRQAQALQQDLYEYAPTSNPAKDYLKTFEQISSH